MIEPPYYPIVYLRGYAGTRGELEATVSTPYMGFNVGSTRVRQLHTGEVLPHVFESPVIRLMKDHGYVDAYSDGRVLPQGPTPGRSIWIFRYYDVADEDFGDGRRREIEFHARELQRFLRHVRDAVLGEGEDAGRFRAYLVAHSMGGLICRCYLQNRDIPDLDGGRSAGWQGKGVDKVFTYGTPHGGIELRRGLGWLEGLRDFLDPNNAGNFGPARMREFLDLPDDEPLDSLNGRYPAERVFCLVGTDSRDYGAALGLSKHAVGPLSDGLVQIRNAAVRGGPRAFVHRSHGGHYGLVNSESGYQNLSRFLFGDTRVVVEMTDVEVVLPRRVARAAKGRREAGVAYHIDTVFSVRGLPVELSRRAYSEGSAIFRTYEQLTGGPTRLFTAFLLRRARVVRRRRSSGFALRIEIRVPDYHAGGRPAGDYYEGGLLFVDKLNVEVAHAEDGRDRVKYGWDRRTPNRAPRGLSLAADGGARVGTIPFGMRRRIRGVIRITVTGWNAPPNGGG